MITIDRRPRPNWAALDRDAARAAHPLFVPARFRHAERCTIAPPWHQYQPIPDAAEALRRILNLSHVALQDGRLVLTIELSEPLEDFLMTFEAAAEDLEDGCDAEPEESDSSEEPHNWHGGSLLWNAVAE